MQENEAATLEAENEARPTTVRLRMRSRP